MLGPKDKWLPVVPRRIKQKGGLWGWMGRQGGGRGEGRIRIN